MEHLRADARNGLYAVDLGKLTTGQYHAVALALRGPVTTSVRRVAGQRTSRPEATKPSARQHRSDAPALVLPGIIVVLALAGAVAVFWRKRPGGTPDQSAAE